MEGRLLTYWIVFLCLFITPYAHAEIPCSPLDKSTLSINAVAEFSLDVVHSPNSIYDWTSRGLNTRAQMSPGVRSVIEGLESTVDRQNARLFLLKLLGTLSLTLDSSIAYEKIPSTLLEGRFDSVYDLIAHLMDYVNRYPSLLSANIFFIFSKFLESDGFDNTEYIAHLVEVLGVTAYKGVEVGHPIDAGSHAIIFEHPGLPEKVYKIFYNSYDDNPNGDGGTRLAKREYVMGSILNLFARTQIQREFEYPWHEIMTRDKFPGGYVLLSSIEDKGFVANVLHTLRQLFRQPIGQITLAQLMDFAQSHITSGIYYSRGSGFGSSAIESLGDNLKLDLSEYNIAIHPDTHDLFIFDF